MLNMSLILLLIIPYGKGQPQITALDSPIFVEKFRSLRGFALNFIGTTGDDRNKFKVNQRGGVGTQLHGSVCNVNKRL